LANQGLWLSKEKQNLLVTQQLSVVIVDFERTVMDAFMIGLAEEKGMVVRESFASVNV
jgi:hypothetical protein